MDVVQTHAEGMSFVEIAEATGYHGTTTAQWIKAGGPAPKAVPGGAAGGDDRPLAKSHR